MNDAVVRSLIETEYRKLQNLNSHYEKLNIVSAIIEIKKKSTITDGIYGDIKQYLLESIYSIEEKRYHYYNFEDANIIKVIGYLPLEQQINIIEYFLRELKKSGIENKNAFFIKTLKAKKIEFYWCNITFSRFFRLLSELINYNLITLIISVFAIYFLYSIILFPTDIKSLQLFELKYITYCHNKTTNHYLNTLLSFFDVESEFKIIPKNLGGILILVLFKLFVLSLVLDIVFNKMKKIAKIHE